MTKYSQSSSDCIIAFEVSKASLTVHFMPEDRQVTITNTEPAIRKVLRAVSSPHSALIVCEASGGYEWHVLKCCAALDLPVHRAHGSRTRNFARYLGLASKTDAIDARMLAQFAQKSDGLRLWQQPTAETVELRALRLRRDDLAQLVRIEQNRLEHPTIKAVQLSLKRRAMTESGVWAV